jgi:hypothetical protein
MQALPPCSPLPRLVKAGQANKYYRRSPVHLHSHCYCIHGRSGLPLPSSAMSELQRASGFWNAIADSVHGTTSSNIVMPVLAPSRLAAGAVAHVCQGATPCMSRGQRRQHHHLPVLPAPSPCPTSACFGHRRADICTRATAVYDTDFVAAVNEAQLFPTATPPHLYPELPKRLAMQLVDFPSVRAALWTRLTVSGCIY